MKTKMASVHQVDTGWTQHFFHFRRSFSHQLAEYCIFGALIKLNKPLWGVHGVAHCAAHNPVFFPVFSLHDFRAVFAPCCRVGQAIFTLAAAVTSYLRGWGCGGFTVGCGILFRISFHLKGRCCGYAFELPHFAFVRDGCIVHWLPRASTLQIVC